MILTLLIIALLIPTPALAQDGGWEWDATPAACAWTGGCDAAGAGVITAGGDNDIEMFTCDGATTSLLIAVDDTSLSSANVILDDDFTIERALYIEGHAIARIPPMQTITHTLTLQSVGPYTGTLNITGLEARCVQDAPTRPARSLAVDDPAFDAIQPYEFHKGTTGFTRLWDFFDVLENGREAIRWMLTTLIMLGAGLEPLGMGLWIIIPLALTVGVAIIKHVTEQDAA